MECLTEAHTSARPLYLLRHHWLLAENQFGEQGFGMDRTACSQWCLSKYGGLAEVAQVILWAILMLGL